MFILEENQTKPLYSKIKSGRSESQILGIVQSNQGQSNIKNDYKTNSDYLEYVVSLPSSSSGQKWSLYISFSINQGDIGRLQSMMGFLDIFDLLIIMLVFSLISRSLISLLRRIYYFLFAQINLFTYKLGKFNQAMLNPVQNKKNSRVSSTNRAGGVSG